LALLQQIDPPCGKYDITGNHEFYAGLKQSIDQLEGAGFIILRNRVILNAWLSLTGIHDINEQSKAAWRSRFSGILPPPPGYFSLLLRHKPIISPQTSFPVDLQLSGHTHRGQIFPFSILTRLAFPYHSGLYRLGNGSHIYVSNGAGTWGPPIRFMAPPEITIFDFIHRKGETKFSRKIK
jgi:predicted MPP superfamily phosphohydrolase